MGKDGESWDEYRLLVLKNTERLEKGQIDLNERMTKMEVDRLIEKTKSRVYHFIIAGIFGLAVQLVFLLVKFYIHKLSTPGG